MKRVLITILSFVLFATTVTAQWDLQKSGTGDHLWCVKFVDATTGWTAGGWGGVPILKTTDGGATWVMQTSGTSAWLYGMDFYDRTTGMIVGDAGTALVTTDGGGSWTKVSTGTTVKLSGVVCINTMTYIAVGVGGTILRTTDRGTSWSTIPTGTGAILYGIAKSPSGRLCVVGDAGTVLTSQDAGVTWTQRASGTTLGLGSVSFGGALECWAVGQNGTIVYSADGGVTWTAQESGFVGSLGCVAFVTPKEGYVSGQDQILTTKDGGKTWAQRKSPTTWLLGASAPTSGTAFLVGHYGRIYKTVTGGDIVRVAALQDSIRSCQGSVFELRIRLLEGAQPVEYTWTMRDGAAIPAEQVVRGGGVNDTSITLVADVRQEYRVIATDSRDLRDTATFVYVPYALPYVAIREQPAGVLEAMTDVPANRASYQWYRIESDTTVELQYENKPILQPQTQGTYSVRVHDSQTKCSEISDEYAYIPTGIAESSTPKPVSIVVLPNPSSDVCTIQCTSAISGDISICTLNGTPVVQYTHRVLGDSIELDLSGYAPGVYMIAFTSATTTTRSMLMVLR